MNFDSEMSQVDCICRIYFSNFTMKAVMAPPLTWLKEVIHMMVTMFYANSTEISKNTSSYQELCTDWLGSQT